MLSCETQAGLLILLAFPFVDFCFVSWFCLVFFVKTESNFSTGVESEKKVRRKKAIVRIVCEIWLFQTKDQFFQI